MITKSDWRDWTKHPVTRLFIDGLMKNRLDRLDEIGDGKASGEELYLEIGRTQGIKDSIRFALDEMRVLTLEDEETTNGESRTEDGS